MKNSDQYQQKTRTNMANRLAAGRSPSDCLSDLVNVIDNIRRLGTDARLVNDTSWRNTVQIFASNRYSYNEVDEGGAIGVDGILKSKDLIVDVFLSRGCPQS